jgi:POT family proton-dependent oligopeptide transporter
MSEVVVKQGHPKGLWVLFGTEMWERFNFYGMRAILTLFMVNSLLIKEADAAIIYGGFLALCYLTPLLGGFISDKYIGNRYSIMLGGTLMAIGQFLLFISASTFDSSLGSAKIFMWVALFVIIFGNGFFKPNISSMVGSLYPKQEKSKLDSAFTIFYMGINIGAFLGQFICPWVGDVKDADTGIRDIFAFKWGFLAASIAMIIGTISAIAPGSIISRIDALVEIATHFSYSGLALYSIIPGISRNCLLTSFTISIAALPTAEIQSAEKINGIIPPTKSPAKTSAL